MSRCYTLNVKYVVSHLKSVKILQKKQQKIYGAIRRKENRGKKMLERYSNSYTWASRLPVDRQLKGEICRIGRGWHTV